MTVVQANKEPSKERPPKILVVTDIATDGELIHELISAEFDDINICSRPEKFVEEFEKIKPTALMLAFKYIEKARECYENLFRTSLKAHSIPHRTLLLCSKEEVPEAYAECAKRNYDDYVLFWPMAQDGYRLRMSVHHAIQYMSTAEGVSASELAIQARRIKTLEKMLAERMEQGDLHITSAQNSMGVIAENVSSSASRAAGKIRSRIDGELGESYKGDGDKLEEDLRGLLVDEFTPSVDRMREKFSPIRKWRNEFQKDIEAQLTYMRELQRLADEVRPSILAFEDEDFHQKLIARVLEGHDIDLYFVKTAAAGLLALRTFRPDLILMDIGLPDVSGIEAIGQIKAIRRFSNIPIIVLTGHSEKERVIKSVKAGASEFIVKPFDPEAFIGRIKHFVAVE